MKKIYSLLLIPALLTSASTFAQTQQTAFFLDNNIYQYRTSPSLPGEKGYLGIAVGNINLNLQSDLGINSFLFPVDNGLVTGLNPAVSSSEFLGGLKTANSLNLNLNENILGLGFWGKSRFYSIELNVRADMFASLPYDLFAFLKQGTPRTYDLSALHAAGNAYAELALGSTHDINKRLTVGARLKVLAGLANINANFKRADFTIGDTNVSAAVDGDIRVASTLLDINTKASNLSDAADVMDFNSIAFNLRNARPSGYGLAIDLGATYRPFEDLEITASVLDLGAISWTYNILGNSNASATVQGLREDAYLKDTFSSIGDELNAAKDEFLGLTEFHKSASAIKSMEGLSWTANAAARYRLPFYKRLSAGALMTYRNSRYTGWFDARAAVTLTPLNFLSLTANYGASSFGAVCGAAASVNLLNFNLVLCVDGYSGSLAEMSLNEPQLPIQSVKIPLGPFKYNARLGLNLTFGSRHNAYKKVKKAVAPVDNFDLPPIELN